VSASFTYRIGERPFRKVFQKFFVFFQKHLAKHALPDSKDRRTRKMRKATASP
jgi:hypothetical protein